MNKMIVSYDKGRHSDLGLEIASAISNFNSAAITSSDNQRCSSTT